MKLDTVERLAFAGARRLRTALDHPATANDPASGYGTVCMTGHPVLEGLWLQCARKRPERALITVESATANMAAFKISGSFIHQLPGVLYRNKSGPIYLMTRMWVLDDLRWLSQRDAFDPPRALLDTVLSKLNHGNMCVTIRFDDLVCLLKREVENDPCYSPAKNATISYMNTTPRSI